MISILSAWAELLPSSEALIDKGNVEYPYKILTKVVLGEREVDEQSNRQAIDSSDRANSSLHQDLLFIELEWVEYIVLRYGIKEIIRFKKNYHGIAANSSISNFDEVLRVFWHWLWA